MRVIAGEFRSRVIKTPTGDSTRPTPDRLRESLFNILSPRIAGSIFLDAYAGSGSVGIEALSRGAKRTPTRPTPDRLRESLFNILSPRIAGSIFLDAYAGSGSVGIEALSRGASKAIFIEKSRAAMRALQENVAALGIKERCEVCADSASSVITRFEADIVFLDPPYPREMEYVRCLEALGGRRSHWSWFSTCPSSPVISRSSTARCAACGW